MTRVLVIKLSSLGDVVHTLPAVESLARGFEARGEAAEIDWLVEEPASGVLKGHPRLANLIVVKRRGWSHSPGENLRVARFLASRRYDMALDFQGLLKSGVWVWLSRARRRIGFSNYREGSHVFLNEKLPPYDPDVHAVERYLQLARHAGGAEVEDFAYAPGPEATREAGERLREAGVRNGYFVLATRARWATKLWSDGKFAELGTRLVKSTGLKCVLVGGPSDEAALEGLKGAIGPGAVNLAGKVDLNSLFSIMSRAEFAVTVDSGPMHVAAASGIPVVALFGPTAPWRTGPYGAGHRVIRKDLECSPCFQRRCADTKCMDLIGVDEVAGAVEGLLEGGRARR